MSSNRPGNTRQERQLRRLRGTNVAVGLLHLAQAVLIVFISNDFTIDVTAVFQEGPPGTDRFSNPESLFAVPFGYAIAVFLGLAALDHLLVASPPAVDWYERNLGREVNYARWIEYSLSASIMIVLIAMLTGITSVYALVGVFAINATMIWFGLLMERVSPDRTRPDWLPFLFGSLAGIVPWIIIAIALGGASARGDGVPTFVFVIFLTLFVFFNSFAINMLLQYRRVGRWRNYLYGERAYILLSLGAKSALAWQVFGGTLAD